MDADFKAEFLEILELVKACPEGLQPRAFDLLVQHLLRNASSDEAEKNTKADEAGEEQVRKKPNSGALDANRLPLRVKAFLKKHSLSTAQLEALFHIEGDEIEPIWSLTTSKFAEAQIQIALLIALQHALKSGEFTFKQEEVRKECNSRRTYDNANFQKNFKSRESYFSKLDKDAAISLTDEGMKSLAKVVKDMSAGEKAK